MSPKIRHWLGLGGLGAAAGRKLEAGPGTKPDPLGFRPDPSKMYLPPSGPHRGAEPKLNPPHVELERKAAPALYQSTHFEDPSSFMSKDDIELAKRLCHRIDAETWPRLYAAFQSELQRARGEGGGAGPSSLGLEPDWCAEPWYYVSPGEVAAGEGAQTDSLPGLSEARALGFRNVALLGALESLDLALVSERAGAMGLRVTTELELEHAEGRFHEPSWLAGVLRVLASEVRRGVLGVRTHGIDQIDASAADAEGGSTSAHAFQALIKLFLRILCPSEIVVPELRQPTELAVLHAGGALDLHGASSPAEGDLIHWHEGMLALRTALERGDRAPLHQVLEKLPTLLHGARRLCSLEHHDFPGSLLDLVAWNPERLSLAFALLYFLPATPAIYSRSARALPAGRTIVRRLNRLRRRSLGLSEGNLLALGPVASECLFWCRAPAGGVGSGLALAANLSDRGVELRLSRAQLERAGLPALQALRRPGQGAGLGGDLGEVVIGLPPFGFEVFRVRSS